MPLRILRLVSDEVFVPYQSVGLRQIRGIATRIDSAGDLDVLIIVVFGAEKDRHIFTDEIVNLDVADVHHEHHSVL